MSIRWRIFALEIATVVSIAVMIAATAVALWLAGHFVARIDVVHQRFEVLAEIDGYASNYSAQLAEVLLLGRDKLGELQAARVDLERAFARLSQITRDEIASLGPMDSIEDELPELENARRMIELYHAIDLTANRVLALDRDGLDDAAQELFERDVEFRLANEFKTLTASGLAGEREEVGRELGEIRQLQSSLLLGAGALAVLAIAGIVVLGVMLRRSIVRPVQNLTAGANAIATGDLDHRIEPEGSDELSRLSETFNVMAHSIKEQRARLVEAGERMHSEIGARTRQLREANESLRNIDSRRARFLADVSHQLRTPLTILRGEADVALRGQPDAADLHSSLERIQGQAAELGQLLDDLITFARTEGETPQHNPQETRLDEIVAAAAQEGEVLAEPREVTIALDLQDGGAHIDADFRFLKQALIIGLDNAIKHSPPGTIVGVATALSGANVEVRISDQGPGIAEEDRPRVFERFFRGSSENEYSSTGLGIGLAIAKEIVERHGGAIALDNSTSGGAVLTIILPLPHGAAR